MVDEEFTVSALGLPDQPMAAVIAVGRNDTLRQMASETGGAFIEVKGLNDDSYLETLRKRTPSAMRWPSSPAISTTNTG